MFFLLWFIVVFLITPVWCYQSTLTSSGEEVKWNYSSIPLSISNSSSSLPSSSSSVAQAISEWNSATGLDIYLTSSSQNKLVFLSDFSVYGSAVVGVTEVNHNSSGVINSASIYLNEQHYDFTDTPGMAVGNQIYLKDVLSHEMGHFLGLSHSEVLDSTMFYANYPGQAELSSDDKAGIRSKYDSGYGRISGFIKGGNQVGVLGSHVQAISRKTGKATGVISLQNGAFEIGGLDLNDTYYLYVSPLKNLNALPSILSNVQAEFCPGSYIGSFFTACGEESEGLPQGINLTPSHSDFDVGTVSINCSLKTQEEYSLQKLSSSFSGVTIFNYASEPSWQKSYVGYFINEQLSHSSFSQEDVMFVDLRNVPAPSGKILKIKLISQVFGNPIELKMEVNQNGSAISGSPFGKSTQPFISTYNLDLSGTANLSSSSGQNIFELKIRAKKLSTLEKLYSFPDVTNFTSTKSMPYLVILSIENGSGLLMDSGVSLSDNASCLDAPFTYEVKNSRSPEGNALTQGSSGEAAASAATCATIDIDDDTDGQQPPFAMNLFMGFACVSLLLRFRKKAIKFLS